jgi:hypothetical protein
MGHPAHYPILAPRVAAAKTASYRSSTDTDVGKQEIKIETPASIHGQIFHDKAPVVPGAFVKNAAGGPRLDRDTQ